MCMEHEVLGLGVDQDAAPCRFYQAEGLRVSAIFKLKMLFKHIQVPRDDGMSHGWPNWISQFAIVWQKRTVVKQEA